MGWEPNSLRSKLVTAGRWEQDPERITAWLLECFEAPDYQPPVLPGVALRLWRLTEDPEVQAVRVVRVLEEDAMLTASLIRLASSAIYGASTPLRSIDEVVARLGLRRVRQLFLQAALSERVFRASRYERAMAALRNHSVGAAYVARMLAAVLGRDEETAFLHGLLHDVGIAAGLVALSERLPSGQRPELPVIWPALIAHHEAVAARLLAAWNLPVNLAPITHHHLAADAVATPAQALVALADAVVSEAGVGIPNELAPDALEVARRQLGLQPLHLARVREQAELHASLGDP